MTTDEALTAVHEAQDEAWKVASFLQVAEQALDDAWSAWAETLTAVRPGDTVYTPGQGSRETAVWRVDEISGADGGVTFAGRRLKMTALNKEAATAFDTQNKAKAEGGDTAIGRSMREIQMAVSGGGDALQAFADIAKVSSDEFTKQWTEDPVKAFDTFLEGLATFGRDAGTELGKVGLGSDRLSKVLPVLATNRDAQARARDEAQKKDGAPGLRTEELGCDRYAYYRAFLDPECTVSPLLPTQPEDKP